MDDNACLGLWLCKTVVSVVERMVLLKGRPLRLDEIITITSELAEQLRRRHQELERSHGAWAAVAQAADYLGRPLSSDEARRVVAAFAERGNISAAETTAMLTEALRKGAPTDEAPTLKRKRPLSMTKGAIASRECRQRAKDRAARRVEVVEVEVGEKHIDGLEAAGHYDARLERINPTTAIASAIKEALDEISKAYAPAKKRR